MPVRADNSRLLSATASMPNASSTTRPLASVVAKPASPALSASTTSADGEATRIGFGRGGDCTVPKIVKTLHICPLYGHKSWEEELVKRRHLLAVSAGWMIVPASVVRAQSWPNQP